MTRNIIVACCTLATGALVVGLVFAQGSGTSIVSKQYSITNIDPSYFKGRSDDGTFSVRGRPRLHAVLTEKRLTLDAATLDGRVDTPTSRLKTAKLGGGVLGNMESPSADGPEHITFSGSGVLYTNRGGAGDQSADFDVTGGVHFGTENTTVPRKLSVTGSHGLFMMRPVGGEVGLESADLDGPVTLDFSGVRVDKDKQKTPVTAHATGAHLTIRRSGTSGTDYVIRLSGGAVVHGNLVGPFDDAVLTAPVIDIELDSKGNFQQFSTEGETAATVTPGKQPV